MLEVSSITICCYSFIFCFMSFNYLSGGVQRLAVALSSSASFFISQSSQSPASLLSVCLVIRLSHLASTLQMGMTFTLERLGSAHMDPRLVQALCKRGAGYSSLSAEELLLSNQSP